MPQLYTSNLKIYCIRSLNDNITQSRSLHCLTFIPYQFYFKISAAVNFILVGFLISVSTL